ncbi:HAD family hydrolase [Vibrio sp. H11]|uniref:HAD family hydrolase n=1 Tax=Vibrio sp. H11 TaxID=2565928 RepID=UPI0010A5CCA4|nr:HAD family hydrolase [Vibrio sp. H11]
MQSIHNYDIYIFDCDGVILDSNQLKIDAMERALCALSFDKNKIDTCISYFANNFGKSRFHHVNVFLDDILEVGLGRDTLRDDILESFSNQCKTLYIEADLTPGFLEFVECLQGNKYVASGSEQSELREIFKLRGLDKYFTNVFGSPTPKATLLENILKQESNPKAIMFGDAISDLEAAIKNSCEFIAYIPFSNVPEKIKKASLEHDYKVILNWEELAC